MMVMMLWTRHSLEEQVLIVKDNILFKDNKSTMLLANNRKQSSVKRTGHIEIKYYFVTDNVRRSKLRVDYCPTDNIIGDLFTKPLQGAFSRSFTD